MKLRLRSALLGATFAAFAAAPPASAQLMLPGALKAGPEDAGKPRESGDRGAAPAKRRPVEKPPGEEAIVGRELARNGSQGRILLQRNGAGDGLEISALSFEGEGVSHRGETCRIDVVSGAPIEAKPNGRPRGVLRYAAAVEACPFSFDVLDGAILVSHEGACVFADADCRADPNGLWGPPASSFDDKQIKQLEKARGRAETTMRANFRALLSAAGKDKETVKRVAAGQAGFSSEREMVCRSYVGEETHGFCALKLTQERGFSLAAELSRSAGQASKRAEPASGRRAETKKAPTPPNDTGAAEH